MLQLRPIFGVIELIFIKRQVVGLINNEKAHLHASELYKQTIFSKSIL